MEYAIHVAILFSTYTTLAVSLDLVAGRVGLLSVAHAAFFGLGAYASALVTLRLGASFPIGVIVGVALAVGASSVLIGAARRLVDDYFVLAALGFQIVLHSVFSNWISLTGGPLGVAGISTPNIGRGSIGPMETMLLISAGLAAVAWASIRALYSSPFGLVLDGIREDEIYVQSLGHNPLPYKATALIISSAFAAAAGGVYAHYVTYIDPSSFTVMDSVNMLSMVIIGGAGGRYGPVVGALLLVLLWEGLRLVGTPSGLAANLVQMIYGAMMLGVLIFRPRGIAGRHSVL